MQTYVDSQPHLGISARLDHYCDEATFVDWEQASADLPDWQTSGFGMALLLVALAARAASVSGGGGRLPGLWAGFSSAGPVRGAGGDWSRRRWW
jgi:hypothetical protein